MLRVSPPPFQNCKRFDQARAMIKTGTYTGNGADDRNIDIGVNLAAKNNVYVIIKGTTGALQAHHRIEYAQGDLSMSFMNSADVANGIQAFTDTGFQVGSLVEVNENGQVFRYIAFWEEP